MKYTSQIDPAHLIQLLLQDQYHWSSCSVAEVLALLSVLCLSWVQCKAHATLWKVLSGVAWVMYVVDGSCVRFENTQYRTDSSDSHLLWK